MATILPFIRSETAFDDATTRVMGLAFDAACTEFQNTNLTNFAREILAERIIQAAKLGERDPEVYAGLLLPPFRGRPSRITATTERNIISTITP